MAYSYKVSFLKDILRWEVYDVKFTQNNPAKLCYSQKNGKNVKVNHIYLQFVFMLWKMKDEMDIFFGKY